MSANLELVPFKTRKKQVISHLVSRFLQETNDFFVMNNYPKVLNNIIFDYYFYFPCWNRKHSSKTFVFSNDGYTITNIHKGFSHSIYIDTIFESGIHSFEIQISNYTKGTNTLIGITKYCIKDKLMDMKMIYDRSSKCISSHNGKKIDSKNISNYGNRIKFNENCIIKCILDFNNKTVQYFKNNKDLGIAFYNLKGKVRPMITVSNAKNKTKYTILSVE